MKPQKMIKYQQSIDVWGESITHETSEYDKNFNNQSMYGVNLLLMKPKNILKYQQSIDVWGESITHETSKYDKISTINRCMG